MKKILVVGLCIFKLAIAVVAAQKDKDTLIKTDNLDEVIVKGKRKLRKTLPYKKVTALKERVYSFDSYVVNDALYVFGGDVSSTNNRGKGMVEATAGVGVGTLEKFVKLLRRFKSNTNEYSDELQVFDLKSKEWIKNKVALSNRAYHNVNYYDGNFYVLGGKRLSKNKRFEYLNDKIEIVNIDSLSTQVDDTNPHQAINFASDVYKNYLVVMGGSSKKSAKSAVKYSNKTHFFDLKTGLWYKLPDMPVAKEGKGVLVRHKFFLIGGYNGKELAGIESFDFVSGEWKKEMNLPLPMKKPGLAASKEQIFIYDKNVILVYDTRKDEMRKYYIGVELEESNLHIYQEALYIVGGFTKNEFAKEPSGNIYKIDLKEFNKTEFDSF
ncbi:kelch repeat-containing protein [uncultured Tenacibaculum sp.]|uniref:kelch repeat-containing protein n=1 Tax=uncultured Tenacibaculum sp. TaxID=174713 RepID=UPI0026023FB8|nr:kelch repeat-containing protein [uncultured Tenacibaculum sp.]